MCGIAGIICLDPDAAPPSRMEIETMAGALAHRGPDEFGTFRDPVAGLAHARLSIIDLATGQQPLANEDGTLWTVFNGEIFNYLELRRELIAAGHRFRTASDTEVIVHAYEAWGDGAFTRFNGQYALALWETRRRRLVLARDRVGVRPLYVCAHRGRLYFASEVKAIFATDASVPRRFDPIGLEQSFTFWTAVAPRTVFWGVTEVVPGHAQVYLAGAGAGAATDTAFYRPRYPEGEREGFGGSLDDAVATVRSALEEATRLRVLRADVPVGSYLSGGLDSSLIAALGQRARGERISTFSLRFDDPEYDETSYQHAVAAHLHSDHHEVLVRKHDIAAAFPEVIRHAERPILRTAPAPLFLLSRLVRQSGVKVVLTGEGADEMFAGYDLFREAKVRRFWARQPSSKLRPRLLERLYPYLARSPVAQQALARQFFGRNLADHDRPGFAHEPRWRTTRALRRLFSPDVVEGNTERDVVSDLIASLPPEFARWSPLAQDQHLEILTLLSGYLLSAQGDRMMMAHSIEGRFPFLDVEVMALASSLPPPYKLRVLDEKHILKKAAAGLVPLDVVRRRKQPYRAPDAFAFTATPSGAAFEWIDAVMDRSALAEAGVFDPALVAQLWRKCRQADGQGARLSNTDNMAVVGVLSTQLVYQQMIKDRPVARPVTLRTRVEHPEERA
jgi:asparagine synthase (glutamine-hydrolysing)